MRHTQPQKRLLGLDITRGLAIFGMVLINLSITGTLFAADAPISGSFWDIVNGLVAGRAAATFVILAGIGTVIGSGNKRSLYKRALFLLLFGYLWLPIWPADILHFYAFYITIGTTFLFVPNRWLNRALASGIVLLILGGTLNLWLNSPYFQNYDQNFDYVGLWTIGGGLRNLFLDGLHPLVPWTAFYLYGMLLGRQNLAKPRTLVLMLIGGAVVALLAERISALTIIHFPAAFENAVTGDIKGWEALFWTTAGAPPSPLYLIAAAGTSTALIGGVSLLASRFYTAKWTTALVRTGQIALTAYIGHYFLGVLPIFVLAILGTGVPVWTGYLWALVYYSGVVAFAWYWKARHRRGPLEALLRLFADRRWFGKI